MRGSRYFCLSASLFLACSPSDLPVPADNLPGAWRVVELTTVADGQTVTNANPQAGLILFAPPNHYSMTYIQGDQPRALFANPTAPTDSERLAAYDSFIMNTGRYERAGDTLTVFPMIARNPNFAAGESQTYTIRLAGDTLWMTLSGGFAFTTENTIRLEKLR